MEDYPGLRLTTVGRPESKIEVGEGGFNPKELQEFIQSQDANEK